MCKLRIQIRSDSLNCSSINGISGNSDSVTCSIVVVSVVSVMVVANSDRGVCMASALIFHPHSSQNRDVHMDKKCKFLLMIP